jgi:hypothetical protein
LQFLHDALHIAAAHVEAHGDAALRILALHLVRTILDAHIGE